MISFQASPSCTFASNIGTGLAIVILYIVIDILSYDHLSASIASTPSCVGALDRVADYSCNRSIPVSWGEIQSLTVARVLCQILFVVGPRTFASVKSSKIYRSTDSSTETVRRCSTICRCAIMSGCCNEEWSETWYICGNYCERYLGFFADCWVCRSECRVIAIVYCEQEMEVSDDWSDDRKALKENKSSGELLGKRHLQRP